MNAAATFNAWIDLCHSTPHGTGADNMFRLDGALYTFDAHPRRLANGAIQGRIYRHDRGEAPRDIGGFKIAADGTLAAAPEEVRSALGPASDQQPSQEAAQCPGR